MVSLVKLAGYDWESFCDAEGVSCVLFISGCRNFCEGCHSPQTHDFNYGIEITQSVIDKINYEIDKRPFLNALVLSGGDPMFSAKGLIPIIEKLHIPNNNLWCYTGLQMEQVRQDKDMSRLLEKCTHLVDGKFELSKRDITLRFRGSSNQTIWKKQDGVWVKWIV